MKVRILSSGRLDLIRGKEFYDRQDVSAGNHFIRTLTGDIDSLVYSGGIHSKRFGFHRMLASHFPFGIFYEKREDEIVVFRILDLRDDPKRIQTALT